MFFDLLRCLPPPNEPASLSQLRASLVAAEAQGYARVWLAAAPGTEAGAAALCVLAAQVASETSRVGLGLVGDLGFDSHPLHWAEALLQLDQLSDGRVAFAGRLGAGAPDRAREELLVLRSAISGERFSHDGALLQVPELQCHPGPVQQPHPLLGVAGGAAAGALGDALSLPWLRWSDAPTPADARPALGNVHEISESFSASASVGASDALTPNGVTSVVGRADRVVFALPRQLSLDAAHALQARVAAQQRASAPG